MNKNKKNNKKSAFEKRKALRNAISNKKVVDTRDTSTKQRLSVYVKDDGISVAATYINASKIAGEFDVSFDIMETAIVPYDGGRLVNVIFNVNGNNPKKVHDAKMKLAHMVLIASI